MSSTASAVPTPAAERPAASTGAGPPRPQAPWGWLAVPVLLGALARMERWAEVSLSEGVFPLDADSAYHLRRSLLSIDAPVPFADPWMNWPAGGLCHWSPGFDWTAAAFSHLAPWAAPARAIAALPVVLGLVCVVVAFALARRWSTGGAVAPFVAALIVAVAPQQVSIGQSGRVDHHVAEALTGLAALGLALSRPPPAAAALLWLLVPALAVWWFSGSVLYIGLAVAGRLVAGLIGEQPVAACAHGDGSEESHELFAAALGLLGATLLTLWWTAPLVDVHGLPFSFIFPSKLHVALLTFAAVGMATGASCLRLASVPKRLGAFVGAMVGGGALLALLSPSWSSGIRDGIVEFLLAEDPWLARIDEFQAPLQGHAPSQWARRLSEFGGWGLLAALPLAPLGVRALRRRGEAWAAVVVAAPLLVLGFIQVRFLRVALPPLAVLTALGLAALAGAAPGRTRGVIAASLLATFVVDRAPAAFLPRPARSPAAVEALSRTLRELPTDVGREGVLAPWDIGHFVLWHGERPVVTTGFGSFLDAPSFRTQEALWTASEEQVIPWMLERRLGFALTGAFHLGRIEGPADHGRPFRRGEDGRGGVDGLWFAALPLSPLILGGTALPRHGVPHIEHLWPRAAAANDVRGLPFSVPVAWLYERVEGARLEGQSAPDATIELRAALGVDPRTFPWSATTTADAEGRWSMRIPVPTGSAGPLPTSARHEVSVGAQVVEIEVPEVAVRQGLRIPVDLPAPPLASAPPSP